MVSVTVYILARSACAAERLMASHPAITGREDGLTRLYYLRAEDCSTAWPGASLYPVTITFDAASATGKE